MEAGTGDIMADIMEDILEDIMEDIMEDIIGTTGTVGTAGTEVMVAGMEVVMEAGVVIHTVILILMENKFLFVFTALLQIT